MKATCWGLLLLATLWLFPAQAFSSYTYVDLHPPGWNESHATSVNAWGEVAGYGIGNAGGEDSCGPPAGLRSFSRREPAGREPHG